MTSWHCAHIYYHANQNGLLLDCVRPLIGDIASSVDLVYFIRHWRQGPHIRLCVASDGAQFDGAVRPRIDAAAARYFASCPSTAQLDQRKLLALHRILATREKERGALEPWPPDNSVRYEPHDRRLAVLGSEAAASLLERFYHDTTPIAFDVLARIRDGDSRLTIALDLMFATAHAQWPDIRRGFISYRSHAEGLVVQSANPDACRAFCADSYRSQAAAIKARLTAIVDAVDRDRDTIPFVREWVGVLARFRAEADPLISSGAISFAGARWDGDASWDPEVLKHSAFHSALQNNSARLAFMRNDLGFLGYRLMLNYLYLHLGRIGIRPVERLVLCHLAASAVEDLFGVSATELVAS